MTEPTRPVRILVTGSRDWDDERTIEKVLRDAFTTAGSDERTTLVHGSAAGADTIADWIWTRQGLPSEPHPADWERFGRSAGHVRNREMVLSGVEVCFAFLKDNSTGTRNCIETARSLGVPTYVFDYTGPSTL